MAPSSPLPLFPTWFLWWREGWAHCSHCVALLFEFPSFWAGYISREDKQSFSCCRRISMMEEKVDLELLIDEVNSRVVFLECDGDFVDVLLSFLVIPIGAVVRLTQKRSGLGCMDALYESVEKLDVNLFQTQACKDMLLHPNYAHQASCNDLVMKMDDEPQYQYYLCPSLYPAKGCDRSYSPIKNAKCKCGKLMDQPLVQVFSDTLAADNTGDVGVFIKEKNVKYMISDDLLISPTSTKSVLILLKKLGITDCNQFRKELVRVGREEVLHLLKRALVSKTPLSDVFLARDESMVHTPHFRSLKNKILSNESLEVLSVDKKMRMTLFLNKSTKQVLLAEAGEDIVDFLFSFLTFPLGVLPNLHKDILSSGSIHQLHSSVSDLCAQNQVRTAGHSSMLLHPKLRPHYSCQNQMLKIEEGHHVTIVRNSLDRKGKYTARNPKISKLTTEEGGGFVKGTRSFMITDELHVEMTTAFASISVFRDSNASIDDVEVKTVNIGEEEALIMLMASLMSKSPLSEIFGGGKTKRLSYERGRIK